MPNLGEIVGYSYRADTYCEDCTVQIAADRLMNDHDHPMVFTRWTTEVLALWAGELGIADYTDERTYDSSTFPKVILGDQAHDACDECGSCTDRCGSCHVYLGGDCPRTDA